MAAVRTTKMKKKNMQGLIDILTPIAKGYVTDKAFEVCSHGVQVYGGYGYIKEYPDGAAHAGLPHYHDL